jgi:ferredoxin-NADP reductase
LPVGSGITAVRAVLHAALRAVTTPTPILLHYARRPADFAFARELRGLAPPSGLRVHFLVQRPRTARLPQATSRPRTRRLGAGPR